ncbi:MAG TPA: glycosyltransferase family 39 protein [Patescibacteria group bacterium]|nr:glycosyltransferase family 39 protein [Patescibacteria group bacterium]
MTPPPAERPRFRFLDFESRPIRIALLGLVFVLGLATRLTYQSILVGRQTPPVGDALRYDLVARRVAAGGTFSLPDGDRSTLAPGFPYALAGLYRLTGPDWGAARVMQAVLGALTSLFVASLGIQMAGPLAGLAAGLFHAFFPYSIALCGTLWSDPLATLLALLATLALVRTEGWRGHALWGALCALAALTRPNLALMLPIGLFWVPAKTLVGFKRVVVATLAFLAVLAPWTARNWIVHERFVPITTVGGVMLWEGNNPYVLADSRMRGRSVRADLLKEDLLARGLPETDRNIYYLGLATEFVNSNWIQMPLLCAAKLVRMVDIVPEADTAVPRLASMTSLAVFFLCFLAGAVIAWRREAEWLIPFSVPIVSVFLAGVVFAGDARVRAPADAEIILIGLCGLALLRPSPPPEFYVPEDDVPPHPPEHAYLGGP